MPERDVEGNGLVDEPCHVEYSFFLADRDDVVSFRVGFAEMRGKPVAGLYGLVHVVETEVAGHRHRTGSVKQQFKEVVTTVDGQRGVQLEEPVYEEDAEDGSYYCYTVFTLDGYHLRYEWNEPEQEARRVTILSAPDEVVLTEEEAREIACDHWDYTPGDVAEDTGVPIYVVSGGLEQRSGGKNYYVFRAQWLVDNDHLSTLDAVIVDAKTGECLPYDE